MLAQRQLRFPHQGFIREEADHDSCLSRSDIAFVNRRDSGG